MADMIDDTVVTEVWVNAHTATGIAAGKPLLLQNKGPFNALMFIGAVQPGAGSLKGFRVTNDREWVSDEGDTVWVRSENDQSTMCIQEA
ncbi:hypothetical protein CNR34_00041 [Pseudomonas phage nickie]|uniref:Uncharacterized protein n=1 Tax=Pseudomonas phage nickie TaxID=2048977 RepID=A0A2H4P715_9CAUD|nr:hypothetical protein FDJ16_gp124 [Pseudomonas phage nickie]ATW57974.1 hypothetical protein CNR34_00041 [Pseudomonas phage nickie]